MLFHSMLRKQIRRTNPDNLVVFWDDGKERGASLSPSYKANRTEAEHTPTGHFALASHFCHLSGIACYQWEGKEADELIAAAWRDRQGDMVILSGDKDLLQLVGDGVTQYRPGSEPEEWDDKTVRDEYGCEPQHLPMLMALAGDVSDNIEGVPSVGRKTAATILTECDNDWDKVRKHPKVLDSADTADLSLRLIGLRDDTTNVWGLYEHSRFVKDGYAPEPLVNFLMSCGLPVLADASARKELWL